MESLETILIIANILTIAFAILEIILFFKVWGMTNNVKKIKDIIALQNLGLPTEKKTITPADLIPVEKREDIEVGDWCLIKDEKDRWFRVANIEKSEYGSYYYNAILEEKSAITDDFIPCKKIDIECLLKLRKK